MPGKTNAVSGGSTSSTIKVNGEYSIELTPSITWTDEKKNAIITNLRALLAQYETLGVSIYQIAGTGSVGSIHISYKKVTSSELYMGYDSTRLYIGGSPLSTDIGELAGALFGLSTYYLEADSSKAAQLGTFAHTIWTDPDTSNVWKLQVTITWGADFEITNLGSGKTVPNIRFIWSD